jgi:hypothetical protein
MRDEVSVFDQAAVLESQYGYKSNQPMPISVGVSFMREGETPGPETASLWLSIAFRSQGGGVSVPSEATQDVKVKGHPAAYVHGVWQPTIEGDYSEMDWNSNFDIAMLSWKEGELTYTLHAENLGLEADDLIQIAESIPSQ